ncbi:hypothetical protein GCM10027051_22320 [Niabella terrae]
MGKVLLDSEPDRQIQPDSASFLKSDMVFDQLYPPEIGALSSYHWTPLHIIRQAADFLNTASDIRILDIGCGVGKFCLAGACYAPQAQFFGVEQRRHLLGHAELAREKLQIGNATFIHANFTQLDFTRFDHFYFFNAFYENLDSLERIDEAIDYSVELYDYYNRFLRQRLQEKQPGTRLVTFHSLEDEIPPEYQLQHDYSDNQLKCWIKTS